MKAISHFAENITKKESYEISFNVLALSSFSPVRKAKPALAKYNRLIRIATLAQ